LRRKIIMKMKNFRLLEILAILFISMVFFLIGCDEYQSESFQISEVDARACRQIQDTLVYYSTAVRDLTEFNSTWTNENVPQNVPAIIDSLKANGIIVSDSDQSTWVGTLDDVDTNYVCLQTSLNAIKMYTDRVVRLQIMDVQGEFRNVSNIAMPLETVGGCTDEEGLPTIKTRIEYSTPDEEYLLYIIVTDQTYATLEDDEEPILIFSIQ
jgi:hypothetical protein